MVPQTLPNIGPVKATGGVATNAPSMYLRPAEPSYDDLKAEIARLQADNQALRQDQQETISDSKKINSISIRSEASNLQKSSSPDHYETDNSDYSDFPFGGMDTDDMLQTDSTDKKDEQTPLNKKGK